MGFFKYDVDQLPEKGPIKKPSTLRAVDHIRRNWTRLSEKVSLKTDAQQEAITPTVIESTKPTENKPNKLQRIRNLNIELKRINTEFKNMEHDVKNLYGALFGNVEKTRSTHAEKALAAMKFATDYYGLPIKKKTRREGMQNSEQAIDQLVGVNEMLKKHLADSANRKRILDKRLENIQGRRHDKNKETIIDESLLDLLDKTSEYKEALETDLSNKTEQKGFPYISMEDLDVIEAWDPINGSSSSPEKSSGYPTELDNEKLYRTSLEELEKLQKELEKLQRTEGVS